MKKLINKLEDIVKEMLEGIVASNSEKLRKVENFNVIARKEKKNKVGLVSGGGSGHEPAHAGFVGYGMLDAAVAGEVFTSPTPDQVLEGIKAADSGKGVFLIIKNYTGDVMNFEMAAEMAEAEGIKVEKIIVGDDIAVENSTYTIGKRGIAGTLFVHKISGSAAEDGADLVEVKRIGEKTVANLVSMGMSLGACTVPAVGKPGFELGENEVEIGLGIHGEPGTNRENLKSADEHTEYLMNLLLKEQGLESGSEVAVMVNGLGGTPMMELYIINNKIRKILEEQKISINKMLVGNYMTALEMPGFSITILKLDDELKKYLNFKTEVGIFS
ncbi:dihydroxyacetone kinase subunit DhaK [Sebaldella sp. S0638]|uniref:dihydroxyacetone kinase subunit DhaK n=1 Tax=Sebaldella sp. S0638 TaxID=2957809 RepID=UPI00209F46F8|nr:dihydroxyacetone kinase subunit DhaK [Sebaldella sp. S0638]MCP1225964.1 dihydroxyacetone kinase subunit DhaK [Sebaldella sp. S0638]